MDEKATNTQIRAIYSKAFLEMVDKKRQPIPVQIRAEKTSNEFKKVTGRKIFKYENPPIEQAERFKNMTVDEALADTAKRHKIPAHSIVNGCTGKFTIAARDELVCSLVVAHPNLSTGKICYYLGGTLDTPRFSWILKKYGMNRTKQKAA